MHQYQAEYFKVEQGIMGVKVDGKQYKKTPEDPEFLVPAGTFHGFYRHPDSPGPMTVLLSASDSGNDYKLDRVFFENWYGFWHDSLLYHGKMNYIHWLAVYDGGDAYPELPAWLPCRRTLSYWYGVVLGRWIGGMLGYKPFFKEYTTDWDYAVAKMKRSFFQRHLVEESYKDAKSWTEQVKLSSGPKPTNADYEAYTTDLTLKAAGSESEDDDLNSSESGHSNGETTPINDSTVDTEDTVPLLKSSILREASPIHTDIDGLLKPKSAPSPTPRFRKKQLCSKVAA